jgi:hypothetical protein
MEIDAEMKRRGWYDAGQGLAMRVIALGEWGALRVFDGGVGVNVMEVRGLELDLLGVVIRVGLLSSPWLRPLARVAYAWPDGTGWAGVSAAVDIFGVSVRTWHDEGEASHLS